MSAVQRTAGTPGTSGGHNTPDGHSTSGRPGDAGVQTVRLPDLGEGLTESDLVEWLVAPGDAVELNQVVAEVETAKALVQLPSPCAGVVAELLVEPGTTVPVGGALLTITVAGASEVPGTPAPDTPDEPAPAAERTSVLVGYGPPVPASARPQRRTKSAAWVAAHAANTAALVREPRARAGAAPTPVAGTDPRPVTNPLVRKLASDLGVHLERVAGTGVGGAVTREDVLRVLSGTDSHSSPRSSVRSSATSSAPSSSRSSSPSSSGSSAPSSSRSSSRSSVRSSSGSSVRSSSHSSAPSRSSSPTSSAHTELTDTRIPVTGVRKQTAAAMTSSAFSAPHASVHLTVDVTPTLDLLADLQADRAFAGRHLTVLTFVAKAVLVALGRNPALNAHWDEGTGEIVQHARVGLGIAVAAPRGLLVPVVHDADRLQLAELADAIRDAAEAARAGTTAPADLVGGTITLTNIGVFGVDGGTPILVPGQAAIVAMGAVRRRPWELHDEVALRHVMTLSMSFDHRQVDGAEAAQLLHDVGAILARPGAALAMV